MIQVRILAAEQVFDGRDAHVRTGRPGGMRSTASRSSREHAAVPRMIDIGPEHALWAESRGDPQASTVLLVMGATDGRGPSSSER